MKEIIAKSCFIIRHTAGSGQEMKSTRPGVLSSRPPVRVGSSQFCNSQIMESSSPQTNVPTFPIPELVSARAVAALS